MHPRFTKKIDLLLPLFDELTGMKPKFMADLPVRPKISGVYLFSEGKKHWYVGRSRNIRDRLAQHRGLRASDNHASFAFLLARDKAGFVRGQHTRQEFTAMPEFKECFDGAKRQIAVMDFRFVKIEDAVSQAVLEAYCAIVLKTEYNSFEMH